MNAQLLQLLISVAGIALMVGLCRLLFGAGETFLRDIGAVVAKLAHDVPGFRAGQAAISRDGCSVLIENIADGEVYLAVMRGDNLVTRKLARGTGIVRVGNRLEMRFDDFTLRAARLELADAPAWEMKLKGLAA